MTGVGVSRLFYYFFFVFVVLHPLDHPAYGAEVDAELGGDLAAAEAALIEFEDALIAGFAEVGGAQEMVVLVAMADEIEFQKIVVLEDAAEANVVFAVFAHATALFDLFEVVQAGFGMAFADGEGAVGKVDEHFAALQVVDGEGFAGVAFGRVCEHEHAEVVFGFECLEGFHEGHGIAGAFGAAAHVGDVVDNEHAGFGFFDVAADGFLQVGVIVLEQGGVAGLVVELAAVKVFVKKEAT